MARIAVLLNDASSGPLYTAWMFTGALRREHHVDLVAPAARLWPPAVGEIEPDTYLPGASPFSGSVRRAAQDAASGCDLIYAFKAHQGSVGVGTWLRRAIRAPLAVHLDDWDGGYFSEVPRLRRAWYAIRRLGRADSEFHYRVFEQMARRADLLTVSTRALQERFGGSVVRQGVDDRRFRPGLVSRAEARQRLGLAEEVPVVVFVGTPTVHKGIADLVRAVGQLPATLGVRLVVAGAAPDSEVDRLIGGGDRIDRRESVGFGEVPLYVAAADVLCAPQRPTAYAQHQLPAKILHWMMLGGCVLTTDVGDAHEILGGSPAAGVVVPPRDIEALRVALAELIDDPARRLALGEEAARRARERYSWTAMLATLDAEFAKVGVHG